MNYYNEFDPFAAQWLRALIMEGLIPFGDVDERSITEVMADDLKGYTQCHFFAGIGGWSYALYLAGWPPDRPVWTGSCPCQPFSSAGNRRGKGDDRHLWPVWFNLIRKCRPATIFGEQVSSAIAHGWLDDVYQGLESEGYAVGSAVLPACGVGAPHKRDRLWFVADSTDEGFQDGREQSVVQPCQKSKFERCGSDGALADPAVNGRRQGNTNTRRIGERVCTEQGAVFSDNSNGTLGNTESAGRGIWTPENERAPSGDVNSPTNASSSSRGQDTDCCWPLGNANDQGSQGRGCGKLQERAGERTPWQTGTWIDCPDGKQRLVEPGVPLLAHGVPNRVGKLRGYGNAIVPQVAAEFVGAFMDANIGTG